MTHCNYLRRPLTHWLVLAAMLFIAASPHCHSQSILDATSTENPVQQTEELENTTAADADASTAEAGMPAESLIQVLRNSPEVMVEVKSVIADEAQQRGVSVQADSLTDQQVYSQLEASADLRASVTEFLRARGYISEAEVAQARERYQDNTPDVRKSRRARSNVRDSSNAAAALEGECEALPGAYKAGKLRTEPCSPAPPWQYKGMLHSSGTAVPPNITDEPSELHRTAPYNLRALRDLYTQVPGSTAQLKRLGSGLFITRDVPQFSASGSLPVGGATTLDVPLGPDYILGAGDELSIALWGGVSQTVLRTIDRGGRVSLPEAGPVQVAGLALKDAQALITRMLQPQFRDIHVLVSVAQVRSIRVFVVGDVQRPGAYEVSSLASPLTALFAAGGPTAIGSLRILRHFRNQKQIGEIDLYDFMLHGMSPVDDKLEADDTLLVPPAGPQVAVFGAVKRPAIYELKDEQDLAAVLDDAGGLTVAASLAHIAIERIVPHQGRVEVAVDTGSDRDPAAVLSRLRATGVKDGDRIHVATVLPYSEQVVYLQGHVARPGKIAFHESMRLNEVLRSYRDMLPEPADRGEIVRLVPPDLHPEVVQFSVPDVLIGNANPALRPFDTIRIYGRYERDAPVVSIRGEVERPGDYPMFKGMTAADLVRTAGGFKRDALVERADLASYQVKDNAQVIVQRQDVAIGDAVVDHKHAADVALRPGDVLTIHQLTGWNDIGASIIVEGEVAHPGSYSFQAGEHLSDILRRAGGLRPTAYPQGAVLTRPEVASLEEKSRQELIRQIETSAASARMKPTADSGGQSATLQLVQQQEEQILSRLRSQPATGRLVIQIDSKIGRWAGTPADIEVRSGDTLRIPKRPGFVLVTGQVYSPAAVTFMPDHTAGWYLKRAGGATSIANQKEIFIVRANGSVIGRGSHKWFDRGILSTRLDPGDTIVVPQKIIGPSVTWRNLLGTAQVVTSLAIAAAVAGL